jgi:hypothetical protein
MAITIEKLREALPGVLVEPPGLRWRSGDHTFFHYPPLETDWGEIKLLVHLLDEGRFLQFRSIDLFAMSEKQRIKERQTEILLAHNYRKKTVQFGYDPEDGEVCLYVDLPIMDNTAVTRKLMERILASIRVSGGDVLRELKGTLEKSAPETNRREEERPEKRWRAWLRRPFRFFLGDLVDR